MILEIKANSFVQKCAVCGEQRQVNLSRLEAGLAIHGIQDQNLVVLPRCSCGAVEILNRVLVPLEGLSGHHRMVNAVHHRLVCDGSVCAELAQAFEAEQEPPPETRTDLPFKP